MKTSAPFALVSILLLASCGGTTEPPAQQTATPESAPPPATPAPPPPETPAHPAPGTAGKRPPNAPGTPTAPSKPAYTRTDLQAGSGREAQKGKRLKVHYTGWLYDPAKPDMKGRMFDSSKGRGEFDFVLGAGQVIPGWDQGFDGMKVGGRRRLIIPPALGYGVDGAGDGIIPPNSTLIFEMELLDVAE
jgi:FKBP-type peptidyl-prolyl cis-trans isomerase FkpA